MSDQRDAPQSDSSDSEPDMEAEPGAAEAEAAEVEAYDLDEDGKVSFIENVRGELGMIDARAEEVAEEPGLKGKAAKAAHRLLDKLDND